MYLIVLTVCAEVKNPCLLLKRAYVDDEWLSSQFKNNSTFSIHVVLYFTNHSARGAPVENLMLLS